MSCSTFVKPRTSAEIPSEAYPPQVTTIYYLSKQGDGNQGAGTYILSKDRSDAAATAGGFQKPAENVSFDGYTIHSRVPFVPNSVLAFAPCTTAYHAVPHLSSPGHTSRNTLQAFIKVHSLLPAGVY